MIQDKSRRLTLSSGGALGGHELLIDLARAELSLRLLDGEKQDVTRFIFHEVEVFDVPVRPVGLTTAVPLRGFLGTNLLSHFAVHLRYTPSPALVLRDEIPDEAEDLASDCQPARLLEPGGFGEERCLAVISAPLYGGGQMVFMGKDLSLPATRVVVPACAVPDPFDPTPEQPALPGVSGTPFAALIATGLGTSVISRSAFARLQAKHPQIVEQTGKLLYLPEGPQEVSTAQLPLLAIVADQTVDLGPCGELARRRRLLVSSKLGIDSIDADRSGTSVALLQRPVTFAVLDDAAPMIQKVRKELQAHVASVDLILGGSFFKYFELDLDYPAGRVILQCAEGVGDDCRVIPYCSQTEEPSCVQGGGPLE